MVIFKIERIERVYFEAFAFVLLSHMLFSIACLV